METKDILASLRKSRGFTQEALAEKLFVTRQAVSRWETGETVPNTETLKLLSELFGVSVNALLGANRPLVCQCCGMPLDETSVSHEPDGTVNSLYCKWCYTDGEFQYQSMEQLLDFLVRNFPIPDLGREQARARYQALLSQLEHWNRNP